MFQIKWWHFPILYPLQLIYRLASSLRRLFYHWKIVKKNRLPGITISIGNLEVGGTGKSPVVISLCKYLIDHGHKPAILTRGYKSGLQPDDFLTIKDGEILIPPKQSGEVHADESMMQSQALNNVPIIVGAKRYAAAQKYLSLYPEPSHWILDDGFQHLQLQRDIDLVLLDANKPFADRYQLPMGKLRESPRHLKRATGVILTRSHSYKQSAPELIKLYKLPCISAPFNNNQPVQVSGDPSDLTTDIRLLALTAIAKPKRFINSLESMGLKIEHKIIKRDHQRFTSQDVGQIDYSNYDALITTSKDYWRDPKIMFSLNKPIYVVPLKASISNEYWSKLLHQP